MKPVSARIFRVITKILDNTIDNCIYISISEGNLVVFSINQTCYVTERGTDAEETGPLKDGSFRTQQHKSYVII